MAEYRDAANRDAGAKPHPPTVFTSTFARVVAGLVWVAAAAVIVVAIRDAVSVGDWGSAGPWLAGAIAATLAGLAWTLLWRPHLVISARDVVLVNPFRTITVPLARVATVHTQYAFTVETDAARRFSSWVAPSPGIARARGLADSEQAEATRIAKTLGRPPRPGDLAGTASGDALAVLLTVWSPALEQSTAAPNAVGSTGNGSGTVTVRWRLESLLVIAAPLIAAVALMIMFG